MLLDEAEEKCVLKEYSKIWTTLKLSFTAKYFSKPANNSNAPHSFLHRPTLPRYP